MPRKVASQAAINREAPERSVAVQLAAMRSASVAELSVEFRRLYRLAAAESLSRDLIARLVAHRIQERRLGGLDRALAARLDRQAQGMPPGRRLKSGTVLVREHEGTMHEVVVVPGGYCWNEQTFKSLSTIATRITGTSWSGPRFFGLRAKRPTNPKVAAHA